jgi:hypothetical protein
MESPEQRPAADQEAPLTETRADEPAESGADLLSIALLVFFLSLLVSVAAMLVLPRIMG